MAKSSKTRAVCDVMVYFSKNEYLSWSGVKDLEWPDEHSVTFTSSGGQTISINAPEHLVVITEREEVVPY